MPVDIDGLGLEELLQLNRRIVERIKMLRSMQAHLDMMAFDLGESVSFDTHHGRQFGTLIKYNRKTVTVQTGDGEQWRVSPSLLSAAREVDDPVEEAQADFLKKRLR